MHYVWLHRTPCVATRILIFELCIKSSSLIFPAGVILETAARANVRGGRSSKESKALQMFVKDIAGMVTTVQTSCKSLAVQYAALEALLWTQVRHLLLSDYQIETSEGHEFFSLHIKRCELTHQLVHWSFRIRSSFPKYHCDRWVKRTRTAYFWLCCLLTSRSMSRVLLQWTYSIHQVDCLRLAMSGRQWSADMAKAFLTV